MDQTSNWILPASFAAVEDTSLVLSGLAISDVDIAAGNATVTLSVTSGTLTLSASVSGGVTSGQITGNGSSSITITAPVAAINATLANVSGLTFAPEANASGPVTLTMLTSDNGGSGAGGVLTDTDTSTITVSAVNDAPVNTLPASFAAVEDTSLVLSGLAISDVDIAAGNATVTLSVTSGTLTLSASVSGGVTSGQITGNGSSSITITAPVAAINATLANVSGLTFAPAANASGSVTLTMQIGRAHV